MRNIHSLSSSTECDESDADYTEASGTPWTTVQSEGTPSVQDVGVKFPKTSQSRIGQSIQVATRVVKRTKDRFLSEQKSRRRGTERERENVLPACDEEISTVTPAQIWLQRPGSPFPEPRQQEAPRCGAGECTNKCTMCAPPKTHVKCLLVMVKNRRNQHFPKL